MRNRNLLLVALTLCPGISSRLECQTSQGPDTVTINSGSLELRGLLWRPDTKGPFPGVLFNHGSARASNTAVGLADQLDHLRHANAIGRVFAKHGYAFLFLFRRGDGLSGGQGENSGDVMAAALAKGGQAGRNEMQLRILETEQMQDALAGLSFLRSLPDVDSRRVAIIGHSFGGSLALLMAERDSSLRAVVDFSGAGDSWNKSPQLRARLLAAVRGTKVPIFIVHAANDYSLEAAKALDAEMTRLGKLHRMKIYPPFGRTPDEGHSIVYLAIPEWEHDVFAFLDEYARPRF